MPRPTCAKCDADSFIMVKYHPGRAAHPVNMIQCERCGAVVGAVPLEEATTLVKALSERVRRLCVFLGFDVDLG